MSVPLSQIDQVFRECRGRAVATLARRFGDLGLAEEMVQEAFVQAVKHWPQAGPPPNPAAWIITTARHAAVDKLRREATREQRQTEGALLYGPEEESTAEDGPVLEDQLRLMFTCCHPALAPQTQVALTLRLVAGLETTEIARTFLVPEATMAQRLVRAKNKIRDAKIPYRVPGSDELPERLPWVLAVVYFIFNEGYVASGNVTVDQGLGRADLVTEAIRLARHLVELMPEEPETRGLLALLLLIDARRAARTASDGTLIPLGEQDRTRWDVRQISEGKALVRACLKQGRPGPYQIQAAVNAVHSDAATAKDTAWDQIVALYEHLLQFTPTPVVQLNRAVAIGEARSVAEALALIEPLPLQEYHLFHAVRAELLLRLGRFNEAQAALERARELTSNASELLLLEKKRLETSARQRALAN